MTSPLSLSRARARSGGRAKAKAKAKAKGEGEGVGARPCRIHVSALGASTTPLGSDQECPPPGRRPLQVVKLRIRRPPQVLPPRSL